jgi:hypothetical protein
MANAGFITEQEAAEEEMRNPPRNEQIAWLKGLLAGGVIAERIEDRWMVESIIRRIEAEQFKAMAKATPKAEDVPW